MKWLLFDELLMPQGSHFLCQKSNQKKATLAIHCFLQLLATRGTPHKIARLTRNQVCARSGLIGKQIHGDRVELHSSRANPPGPPTEPKPMSLRDGAVILTRVSKWRSTMSAQTINVETTDFLAMALVVLRLAFTRRRARLECCQ